VCNSILSSFTRIISGFDAVSGRKLSFRIKHNADLRSLDFTFNRLFMKLFKTNSIDVVKTCQSFTGSEVPSCVLKRKTDKFILRFNCVENTFCNFCSSL